MRRSRRWAALRAAAGVAVGGLALSCGHVVASGAAVGPPASLEAHGGRGGLTVRWAEVEGASGYHLYASPSAGVGPGAPESLEVGSPPVFFPLPAGTSWHVAVATELAEGGESAPSAEVLALSLPGGPLSPVPVWSYGGSTDNEFLGYSVSAAGDVDGDGFDDVVLGAPGFAPPGASPGSGMVMIFRGGPGGLEGSPVLTAFGSSGERLGFSVSDAGDVNGDGFDDVIVGAPFAAGQSGSAMLILGGPGGPILSGWTPEPAPPPGARFGFSVSAAGDARANGFEGVLVGAPLAAPGGTVTEFYGGPGGLQNPGDTRMGSPGDELGYCVSPAGDVNADGYDDVILGAPGRASGGAALLFPGGPGFSLGSATPFTLPNPTGRPGERFGGALAALHGAGPGDFDDVLVGARSALGVGGAGSAGAVYLYFGGDGIVDPYLRQVWSYQGVSTSAHLGSFVAGPRHVDGGSYGGLLFGSPDSYDQTGEAYLVLGTTESAFAGRQPIWTTTGETLSENLGFSVARAGDVNADGYDDVLVAAPRAGQGFRGRVDLYLGGPPDGPMVDAGLSVALGPDRTFQPHLARFVDANGLELHTCTWDFGDQTAPVSFECTPASAGGVAHVYAAPGIYTVRLRVVALDQRDGQAATTVTAR